MQHLLKRVAVMHTHIDRVLLGRNTTRNGLKLFTKVMKVLGECNPTVKLQKYDFLKETVI